MLLESACPQAARLAMDSLHRTSRYASHRSPRRRAVGDASIGGDARWGASLVAHGETPKPPTHHKVRQSPQQSADRSTRRHRRRCHGERRPRRVAPASAGVPGGMPIMGESPQPPRASLALLVVGSRPLGSVPGQHATRLVSLLIEAGRSSRSGSRPSACVCPSSFFPPSVNARHSTAGRALQCQGQALRGPRKHRARPP
jgi:hypothetical protein